MVASNSIPRGCCPWCGSHLKPERIYYDRATRAVIGNGHVRQITPTQAKLFELLWPPSGSFIKASVLEQKLGAKFYHNRHGAIPAIASAAKRLRRALTPLNIMVEGCISKNSGGYRIVVLPPTREQTKSRDKTDTSAHMGFTG